MSDYRAAVTTVAAAAGASFCAIRAGASRSVKIKEIGAFCNAATASSMQLIRPSNTPVATTSVLGQADDDTANVSQTYIDTVWSTAPLIAAMVPLQRVVLPATIGAGVIWTFPNGLHIPVSSSLILWNYGAAIGSALSFYASWEE